LRQFRLYPAQYVYVVYALLYYYHGKRDVSSKEDGMKLIYNVSKICWPELIRAAETAGVNFDAFEMAYAVAELYDTTEAALLIGLCIGIKNRFNEWCEEITLPNVVPAEHVDFLLMRDDAMLSDTATDTNYFLIDPKLFRMNNLYRSMSLPGGNWSCLHTLMRLLDC